MNKPLVVATIFFLPLHASIGQVINYESAGNLQAKNPLACIEATSISPTSTAADITAGAKECTKKQKYGQAAELIMIASAYAYFDKERVSDKTAHGALTALFAKEFGSMPYADKQSVFSAMSILDKDRERKQELCSFLLSSETPSYHPNYMIAHGIGGSAGPNNGPLIKDFKPEEGWAKAMKFVKCDS